MDCGICGRQLVFGGHGQTDHLVCRGAMDYKCWNAITVDGPLATERISEVVFAEIQSISDFDPAFLEMVNEEAIKRDSERDRSLRDVCAKIDGTDREIANLMRFIKAGDESPRVREELRQLERQLLQFQYDKREIVEEPSEQLVIPCAEELKRIAHDAFRDLAPDSIEFGRSLRAVTGRITVCPFRAIDGGNIVLRAKFNLQITNLLPDNRLRDTLKQPLTKVLTVDISALPQRVVHREKIIELCKKMTQREAAKAVGITLPAAQHAIKLNRLMERRGVSDPYVPLMEAPADYSKLRRHLHRRFRFEPVPGYPCAW
jgi:hypothetical protein